MFTRNKLGVAGWIFGNLPLKTVVQQAANLNFAGLTLQAGLGGCAVAEAKQMIGAAGLEIFALTPLNVDLAHPDDQVRQTAVNHYLSLLDVAAEVGCPLVVCQGMRGRTQPIAGLAEERELLITAVSHLAQRAQEQNLSLALNVCNRYESHLFNTCADALSLVDQIGAHNVGVVLSAFHMNIEEQDAAAAIGLANGRLSLYHVSDSNRQAVGRGHLKLGLHLWALENIGYSDPIIVECLPPGSNPLAPIYDDQSLALLETYLQETRSWF